MEQQVFTYKYPHPSVTTDCVIFGFDGMQLQVLLIQRGIEPFKSQWAFPGGFLRMDEDAQTGALRELREETGLETAYVKQFHTFSSPARDPRERVITIAHYALVRLTDISAGDDAAEARWFPLGEVPQLAFDHDLILRTAMAELRKQIHFEPIGFELLPECFTMRALQTLYESILGVHFDRRNFAKKMLHLGLLTQEDCLPEGLDTKQGVNYYRFNSVNYQALKQKGFRLEF